jgi:uncharacterized protein DUF6694
MMSMCTLVAAAFFSSAYSGAIATKIDASSQEAYERSVQTIESTLAPDDIERFEQALRMVTTSAIVPSNGGIFRALAAMENFPQLQRRALASVDGKTYSEIIELASQRERKRAGMAWYGVPKQAMAPTTERDDRRPTSRRDPDRSGASNAK